VERDAERPRRGFAIVPGGGGRAGERAAGSVALGLGFRAGRGGGRRNPAGLLWG
jgi:hypothetical protein